MATATKKQLIDRISEKTGAKRVLVKRVIQEFLDEMILELGQGNRLEFRDFGVFECRLRARRRAQNPKTMKRVDVDAKHTVKFKVGRLMKEAMQKLTDAHESKLKAATNGRAAAGAAAGSPADSPKRTRASE